MDVLTFHVSFPCQDGEFPFKFFLSQVLHWPFGEELLISYLALVFLLSDCDFLAASLTGSAEDHANGRFPFGPPFLLEYDFEVRVVFDLQIELRISTPERVVKHSLQPPPACGL